MPGERMCSILSEKHTLTFCISFSAQRKILMCSMSIFFRRSNEGRSVFDDSNSTAINQLTQDMLKRAIVPLPPLSEQRRIVEAIGAMLFELNQIEKSLS